MYDIITGCIGVGSKEQESILRKYQSDDNIRRYFRFMLSPEYNYYTKKCVVTGKHIGVIKTVEQLVFELDVLTNYNPPLRGKELEQDIADLVYNCTEEMAHLLKWVIDRKNPAKIGKSIVNKIWPGLIREVFYQGAVPGTDEALDRLFRDSTEVMAEIKEDGMTLLVDYDAGEPVAAYSRQGEDMMPYVRDWLRVLPVFPNENKWQAHFELFVLDEYLERMERAAGNGLINEAVKNGNPDLIKSRLYGVGLDVHPLHEKPEIYSTKGRYFLMARWLYGNMWARPVLYQIVVGKKAARQFANEIIANGGEGLILKSATEKSKNGKPWHCVKMKHEFTVDLEVLDVKAYTRDPKLLGALLMGTSCRGLEVWVNLRCEADRVLRQNYCCGDILRVKAEKPTSSKSKKTMSLSLPRFDGDRYVEYCTEKTEADSLESVLNQYKASIQK